MLCFCNLHIFGGTLKINKAHIGSTWKNNSFSVFVWSADLLIVLEICSPAAVAGKLPQCLE